jgi:diguanylate cyclase (GGDEF)-like protein/PAS domain S-box-containing protein
MDVYMTTSSDMTPVLEAHLLISLTAPITVLSVTDDIEDLLGFNAGDFLTGKVSLKDKIHAHDQDIADDLFSIGTNKTPAIFNIRIRQANGRIRCVKGHYTKEPDASGADVNLALLLQDAKSLSRNQSQSQSLGGQSMVFNFKAMMENTDDYIYFKDNNHVFTGASQTLVAITAPTEHWTDLLGLTDYDVFAEEYADIYYRLEKQVFSGVLLAHEEQETLDNKGNKGWIDNRKYPIKNEQGEIVGLFGIARDITERKLMEDELKASEARFRTLVENSPLCIHELDRLGKLTSINRAGILMLGAEVESAVVGRPYLGAVCVSDQENVEELLINAYAGQASHFEFKASGPSGQIFKSCFVPIINSEGLVEKLMGITEDITSRKQAERALSESEKLYRSLFENMLNGFAYCQMIFEQDQPQDFIYLNVNNAFETLTGLKNVVGKRVSEVIPGIRQMDAHLFEIYGRVSLSGRPERFEIYLSALQQWFLISVYSPEKGYFVVVFDVITERKKIESDLRIAATVFESQEGMLISDANNVILRVNRAFTRITGYSAEEVIGKNPRILQSGRQDTVFYAAMWQSINDTGAWEGEVWNRRKSGEIFPEHLTITAVKDQDGSVTNYVATLFDITLSKAAADEIEHLAFYDPLTGLPNRRLLMDRLKPALASSHRSGRKCALLFIDLDNFKMLNDTLGHDFGDLLLQQVAERLTSCVREVDTVARLGGDEFVVMLEDLSEQTTEALEQTEVVGNKILSTLNQSYLLTTHNYHSTPSIGAILFNGYEQTIDELLKQADIAMYHAKASGRNTLRFFDLQMQAGIIARVALEADLRQAVAENQFEMYYQLQNSHNSQIIGAEALIRWHHPRRGLVSPTDFIPLAEENGLILSIGLWVLETACGQLKIWEGSEHTRNLQLAVNVSARQFRQPDFVEQVNQVLRSNAINPNRIKLELTESLVLEDIDDTIVKMNALRKIGVSISMDDFGTGHSSLSSLRRLPLDQLKIDQSFVNDILRDPDDAVIVKTIIAMANSLGIEVIAEGVETEAQRAFLEQNDCSLCQGYLFSEPVPIELFEQLLKRGTA